jgi:hypothetical protein
MQHDDHPNFPEKTNWARGLSLVNHEVRLDTWTAGKDSLATNRMMTNMLESKNRCTENYLVLRVMRGEIVRWSSPDIESLGIGICLLPA